MPRDDSYNGVITSEQFLFYEMRICSVFYLEGLSIEEAINKVNSANLFQYPTERNNSRMTRACYRRLAALGNKTLVKALASQTPAIAKQINLYAIMRQNRLVWDFMIRVIGEKYRTNDFSFTTKDINVFFSQLQAQSEKVAAWSDQTIKRIKGILKRMLIEVKILDDCRSEKLNSILICEELEQGIRDNGDTEALEAFNCFR